VEQAADQHAAEQRGSAATPCPATSGIMIGMKAKLVPCTMGSRAPTGPMADGLDQRRDTGEQHRHLDQ
jgi:hypothetical protein